MKKLNYFILATYEGLAEYENKRTLKTDWAALRSHDQPQYYASRP